VNPQRWKQVKAALNVALELPPELRTSYIDEISANDSQLRAELKSLLAARAAAGPKFLDNPAADLDSFRRLADAQPWTGKHVGPYRLIEQIGSGGMGEVYRAIRDDDEYQKQVAVKLIRVGQDSAFIVQRFRNERQILATFEHPNIARLLDGGTTSEGLPYFVMELIDGEPIDRFCDRHSLDVTERLRLFLIVCAAVQYAHQRLTVHRDLKPTNILVTAEGEPRLVDFGIAKILEPQGSAKPDRDPKSMLRIMTPQYASPEQLTGEPITTASDVYALGIVLYELLTGRRPNTVEARTSSSFSTPASEMEPAKPSTAVREVQRPTDGVVDTDSLEARTAVREGSAEKLRKRLRGDLDNIVLMALRRDPARRYHSVEQFAQDIRRHLAHLPVIARAATLRYRAGSFVRRNKVGAAAAALIAMVLVGGIIVTEREASIAESALKRARAESQTSDQVLGYLLSLFDGASPDKTGGKPIDPRTLVDQGQSQIDAHFPDQPLLRARMLAALGTLYCELGQAELCRRDLEQALSIQEGSPGADPLLLARFQEQLASAYNSAGRAGDAIILLNRALPVFEAQRPRDTRNIAAVLNEFGQAYRATRQPAEEIIALERARSLLTDSSGNDSLESAPILGALAIAYSEAGRSADAVMMAETRLRLVKDQLGVADVRYFDALNDYAEVAWEAQLLDEAEQIWRRVIDGYVGVYGRASDRSIDAELSLADALFSRDKLRESIDWFRRSIDDYRSAGALERSAYIGALGGLAQVLWQYGDYHGAEAAAHEAYVISQRMHGPTPRELVVNGLKWGHTLAYVGETRRALELLSIEVPGDPKVLATRRFQGLRLLWLADCYRESGAYALALDNYNQAIELYQSLKQPQSVALTMTYEGKALLLARQRRFAEAVPLLRMAIAGYAANQYLPDGPAIAAAKVELAEDLFALGRRTEAQSLIAEASPIVARELAPTHHARLTLARLRAESPRSKDAATLQQSIPPAL